MPRDLATLSIPFTIRRSRQRLPASENSAAWLVLGRGGVAFWLGCFVLVRSEGTLNSQTRCISTPGEPLSLRTGTWSDEITRSEPPSHKSRHTAGVDGW